MAVTKSSQSSRDKGQMRGYLGLPPNGALNGLSSPRRMSRGLQGIVCPGFGHLVLCGCRGWRPGPGSRGLCPPSITANGAVLGKLGLRPGSGASRRDLKPCEIATALAPPCHLPPCISACTCSFTACPIAILLPTSDFSCMYFILECLAIGRDYTLVQIAPSHLRNHACFQ